MKIIFDLFYQHILYKDIFFFMKFFILLFLIIWLIRNISFLTNNYNNSLIKVINQIKLDTNNKIIILDVQGVKLVLGITLNNMNVLYTIPFTNNDINHQIKIEQSNFKFTFLNKIILNICCFLLFFFYSPNAYATEFSELTKHIFLNNIYNWSFSIQMFIFTFFLALLSVIILMTTSFTRIIIVLTLLRNALGIPSIPPNQLLIVISCFLTFCIMNPIFYKIYHEAYLPLYLNKIQFDEAFFKAYKPIHDFMLHQTRHSDLLAFSKLSNIPLIENQNFIPIQILLPSFITSELKTACQIGFTIFIPFLIIDLFVSSILISLGMMMISPNSISLPIKLILFVMVDGWKLIFSSLVNSFY
ncbi:flagellar biosynthetic protein FliP [Buchnera aphidicola (Therioaphis trifolii)]|uniref:Flagellar biosynthetic protein FliP n=2 Tax=Buchnera aphidicola TaxID=9 RepID=A0A4D6YAY8_9GAMM|nr:flagellar biosynthetic protein FliP [Buchnera aphidicola (Therioaphis trifolii)]